MSTNLRLSTELADALRLAAARAGRSQQEIVREAIAKELGLLPDNTAMEKAVRAGLVEPPEPFRDVAPTLRRYPPARRRRICSNVTTVDRSLR